MGTSQLEKDFQAALSDFSFNMQSKMQQSSCDSDTQNLIDELSRETHEALNRFSDAIIEYFCR